MNHLKGLRPVLVILILVVVLLSAFPTPALAIADPTTPPQIKAVYVFDNIDGAGGKGVLIDYYLDYAVSPNETADQSYLAVFIDIDGTTQLKAVAPYVFADSGYRRGLIWIPFTATEVATYGISSVNSALYRIWLIGNPTLTWPTVPPKTIASIDTWYTTGIPATLLALKVLYCANVLELFWLSEGAITSGLLQTTPLGNKLTTLGESYFNNVIPNLPTLAPSAFSAGTSDPYAPSQNYSVTFSANMTHGTGTVAGDPITFTSNVTVVNATGVGTLIMVLGQGISGNVTSLVGTVFGSPVQVRQGTNTVNVTAPGTLTVVLNAQDIATQGKNRAIGTIFDVSSLATMIGMSFEMTSGLIWFALGIFLCASVYKIGESKFGMGGGIQGGASKIVMLVFDIWIIAGGIVGLLTPIVAILMFIGYSALIGYVLFFRNANV